MVNTDSINIPVRIALDPSVTQAVRELEILLKKELGDLAVKSLKSDIPIPPKQTVTGERTVDVGGEPFVIKGKAKLKKTPEEILREEGELDLANLMEFSATVKEVRQNLNKSIDENIRRFNEFKRSIRFQPLEVKKEKITEFINEFGDINNELTFRLNNITSKLDKQQFQGLLQKIRRLDPKDQLAALQRYIFSGGALVDRARDEITRVTAEINKGTRLAQSKRFDNLLRSIQDDPIKDQIKAIEDYLSNGGQMIDRANDQLRKLRKENRKEEFRNIQDKTADLPIRERLEEWKKYAQQPDAFKEKANQQIRKIRQELSRESFKDLKLDLDDRALIDQIRILEEYINDGGEFSKQARALVNRLKSRIRKEGFKRLKFRADNAPDDDERIRIWQEYIDNGGRFKEEAEKEVKKLRQNISKSNFRQLRLENRDLPIEERIQNYNNYISQGGQFVEEARAQVRRDERDLAKRNFRRFVNETRELPFDEQERIFSQYISSGQEFAEQARRELNRARRGLRNTEFANIKASTRLPIEERIRLWEDYINAGKPFKERAENELKRLKDQLAGVDWSQTREFAETLPLRQRKAVYERYIQSGGQFIDRAKKRVNDLERQISREDFSLFREQTDRLPLEQRRNAYQQYAQSGKEFSDKAWQQVRRLTQQLRRETLSQLNDPNLPIEDRIRLHEQYIAQGKEFSTQAQVQVKKLRDQLNRQDFRKLKIDISGRSLEEQISALNDYVLRGGEFQQEADAMIRNFARKLRQATKQMNRQQFNDWTKKLQLESPEDQLAQLNAYINNRTSQFIDDAKIIRQRLQKSIQQSRAATQRERGRNFANTALVAAGAGLGLLGPAGFPLLNIGFAAMSGGPGAVALVGLTTALGEFSRVVQGVRESAKSAAKELGFVPTSLKLSEAAAKSFLASLSIGEASARNVGLRRRQELLEEQGSNLIEFNKNIQDIIEASKETGLRKTTGGLQSVLEFSLLPFTGLLAPLLKDFIPIFRSQSSQSQKNLLPDAESALRNAQIQLGKPTAGIENDPYSIWMRIQNAALDPTKQQEAALNKEHLERLKEQVKALRENTEALNNNKGNSKPTPGGRPTI